MTTTPDTPQPAPFDGTPVAEPVPEPTPEPAPPTPTLADALRVEFPAPSDDQEFTEHAVNTIAHRLADRLDTMGIR